MSGPLKLAAADAADLEVVSSFLQDAAVPVGEMSYVAEERLFAFVCSRFAWEGAAPGGARRRVYERVNCAVRFAGVAKVTQRGVDRSRREAVLSLLAIRAGPGYIGLVFSGGGEIRLEAGEISCRMDDLDHRWPTRWRPDHERG